MAARLDRDRRRDRRKEKRVEFLVIVSIVTLVATSALIRWLITISPELP
jgi:hypothetical protein